jgi:hypothetical protein
MKIKVKEKWYLRLKISKIKKKSKIRTWQNNLNKKV